MTDESANATREFYKRAMGYIQKYFPPNTASIMLVSFDDPHDDFTNFCPRVTGLHSGLTEMYRQLYGTNGTGEVDNGKTMVNIPTIDTIAESRDGSTMRVKRGLKWVVHGKNVTGMLHEDRYMESLLRSLKAYGVNDAFIIGMATNRTGITKTGKYGDKVRRRVEDFGKKALPWLVEHQKVQEPLIIGIPPLGFDFGSYIRDETKGVCEDYSGAIGTARVMGLSREKVQDRDVVITDSWYTDSCHDSLERGKEQLMNLGANRVFYIAESGPMGHPLVDFSVNVTQYL